MAITWRRRSIGQWVNVWELLTARTGKPKGRDPRIFAKKKLGAVIGFQATALGVAWSERPTVRQASSPSQHFVTFARAANLATPPGQRNTALPLLRISEPQHIAKVGSACRLSSWAFLPQAIGRGHA